MTTTTRKPARFRPRVESLESMLLLSHAASDVLHLQIHAEAKKTPVAVAPVDVALAGTIHLSGKVSGTSATVSGSGKLGQVGTVSIKTKVDALNPPTSLTLSAKKGNITIQAASLVSAAGTSGSGTYTVTGGTKSYVHAYGSGTITASYTLLKGNKVALTVTFS